MSLHADKASNARSGAQEVVRTPLAILPRRTRLGSQDARVVALAAGVPTNILALMHPTVAVARILVVEDSPDVISLLEHVLGEEGYDVLSATDGESALVRALHEA